MRLYCIKHIAALCVIYVWLINKIAVSEKKKLLTDTASNISIMLIVDFLEQATSSGVTGVRSSVNSCVQPLLQEIKEVRSLPLVDFKLKND